MALCAWRLVDRDGPVNSVVRISTDLLLRCSLGNSPGPGTPSSHIRLGRGARAPSEAAPRALRALRPDGVHLSVPRSRHARKSSDGGSSRPVN